MPKAKNGVKECTKCNKVKAVNYFAKSKSRSDGLESSCKKCKNAQATKAQNKRKRAFEAGEIKRPKEKLCTLCGKVKPAKEFFKQHNNSSGLSARCKSCNKASPEITAQLLHERHKEELLSNSTPNEVYKALLIKEITQDLNTLSTSALERIHVIVTNIENKV